MKYIQKLLFGLTTLAILQSCLKDKAYDDGATQSLRSDLTTINKVVEITLTPGAVGNVASISLASTDNILNAIPISVSSIDAPTENVIVTLERDTTLIDRYNTANGTAIDPLPRSLYTELNTTVTIPANSRFAYFKIKIDPSVLIGEDYALPYKIKSVSAGYGVSNTLSTGILRLTFKNEWEGDYTVVGTRYNCTAAGDQGYTGGPIPGNFATAAIPSPKYLASTSLTSNLAYVANLGAGTSRDYTFTFTPGATLTYTLPVSLSASFVAGISNIRWITRTYNPATKTITLLWTYNNQPGGAGNDRIISEVMTMQ
jgi:Domain of unknown function (DUF1735)